MQALFWVETKQIISPSRGFLQIKGVVPSSSCCAGGVPARWRGDSRDGKQPPGIVSSAPPRCVLRSGASHSLQWGGMPALRRRFRNDDGGGILLRLDWELLREHVLTTGVVRHACRHRVTARGGFWFGGFFHMLGAWERHRFNGGAVAVCFEGCCGGMCWPQERQHEGLGVGGLIRCAGRPREWSCGAVPPQERWHEGGWFLFFLWRLLRCRRGILSHARQSGAAGARRGAGDIMVPH